MACVGDSGGLLIKIKDNNEAECLYGVISYASHNCTRGVTVFTRVPSYNKGWISQYTIGSIIDTRDIYS